MNTETGRTLEDVLGEITVAALQNCPGEFAAGGGPEELAQRIGRFMEVLAESIRRASEQVYGGTAAVRR